MRLWRDHANELIQRYGLTAEYGVLGAVNGYAMPLVKRIDVSPINTVWDYSTILHEVGHCARPCKKKGHPHPCVQCELLAWRFAIDEARPHWTKEMHDELARSLPTYRKHGTPTEQREIDDLVSPWSYYTARMQRARRAA